MTLELKKDQTIQISKAKYQVLNILEEFDRVDAKSNKFIGEHTQVELHKDGSTDLHPTHILKLYHDNEKEAVLLEIDYKKPPKKTNNFLKTKLFIKHVNIKKIAVKDIKIIR